MALFNLLDRFLPIFRVGNDTILYNFNDRYAPLKIDRLKLPFFMRQEVLRKRSEFHETFRFFDNKKLTLIVPYRNREEQLKKFLSVLKVVLKKQEIDYQITVVEQEEGKAFNRAKLINVGAFYNFDTSDYYCIHDVDMLPQNADYRCPSSPLRLVTQLATTWREKQVFEGTYFSGSITISKNDFLKVNGFSNEYWGWGKEDDDFLFRLLREGIVPFIDNIGKFYEMPNPSDQAPTRDLLKKNRRKKYEVFRSRSDFQVDGLNNLKYKIIDRLNYSDRIVKLIVDI